jgi:hypothetical protein
MSAAFYPVLEDARPGVDSGVSGGAAERGVRWRLVADY